MLGRTVEHSPNELGRFAVCCCIRGSTQIRAPQGSHSRCCHEDFTKTWNHAASPEDLSSRVSSLVATCVRFAHLGRTQTFMPFSQIHRPDTNISAGNTFSQIHMFGLIGIHSNINAPPYGRIGGDPPNPQQIHRPEFLNVSRIH